MRLPLRRMKVTDKIKNITLRLAAVAVFQGVAESEVMKKLTRFLESTGDEVEKTELYSDFVRSLYAHGCDLGKYILRRLYEDENEYILRLSEK